MIEDLVSLRHMKQEDFSFVIQSWLKSLRHASAYYSSIPKKTYFEAHKRSITQTMNHPKCGCLIAHPRTEPDLIAGYLVFEERSHLYVVLHYVYVKLKYREMGLANLMIKTIAGDRKLIGTHYTRKIKNLSFNPYMFKMESL